MLCSGRQRGSEAAVFAGARKKSSLSAGTGKKSFSFAATQNFEKKNLGRFGLLN